MTKSHLVPINCEGIDLLIKDSQVFFVYFGTEHSLLEGNEMEHINMVASFDKG